MKNSIFSSFDSSMMISHSPGFLDFSLAISCYCTCNVSRPISIISKLFHDIHKFHIGLILNLSYENKYQRLRS